MTIATLDRRRDKRISNPAVVQFREIDENNESVWDMTLTRNISKSGIFFNASMKFQEGDAIEVNLYNPRTEKIDNCVCSVVRSREINVHSLYYETAVKFKELYDDGLKSLYSFMDHSLAVAS